jgi:hypothetical protein
MPYTSPRGICPACGRPVALTLAGRLRVHRSKEPGVRPPEKCAGSKRNPEPSDKEN